MPLAPRGLLVVVLLVFIAGGTGEEASVADAAPRPAPPGATCGTFRTRQQCLGGCNPISVVTPCQCYWDAPPSDGPDGHPLDMSANCTIANATCCWNAPCSQWSDD